jgi:excisionase family DNA binding protein
MSKKSNLSQLLTIRQVAKVLSVHIETLRRWDNDGKLKAVRIGNRGDRRYKKEDIEKILKSK